MSTNARADEDASDDDASIADDAGLDDVDANADDAGPVGLQPTVFDSNLGCSTTPVHANGPDSESGVALMGAAALSAALLRRRLAVRR
jgi:hypothetical protein